MKLISQKRSSRASKHHKSLFLKQLGVTLILFKKLEYFQKQNSVCLSALIPESPYILQLTPRFYPLLCFPFWSPKTQALERLYEPTRVLSAASPLSGGAGF